MSAHGPNGAPLPATAELNESPATDGSRSTPFAAAAGLPLFCFLSATVYLGVCLDPFTPVKTYLLRLVVVAGLLSWISRSISDGAVLLVRTRMDFRLAALAAWTGLTGLWAVNRPLWEDQWSLLLCGIALFYIVVFYFRDFRRVETLIGFTIAPVFAMLPMAVADLLGRSYFPWDRLIVNRFINLFGYLGVEGRLPPEWLDNFSGRISTSFGNPVYLAGWLALMIPVGWVYYRESRTAARKIYSICALVIMMFLLTATFTRSAWMSVAVSFAALAVMARGRGRAPASALPGLAALALAGIVLAAAFAARGTLNPTSFDIKERLASLTDFSDPSLLERSLIWKTGIEMIRENTVWGVGFGNYEVHHPRYQIPFFKDEFWNRHTSFPDRMHNEFLDMWAETGLVGLGLMLLAITGAAGAGFAALKRGGPEGRTAAGILAGGIGLLLYANAQFPLHVVTVSSFVWILTGLLVVLAGEGKEKRLVIRKEPRRREGFLAAVSMTALFLVCAYNFTRPAIGNAAYLWGMYAAPLKSADIGLAKNAMELGLDSEPGSLEMSVRYGNALNAASANVPEAGYRNSLTEAVLKESLRGLAYHPFDSRLYMNAGTAYLKLNEPGKAVKMLENAVIFDPAEPLAFYNLGIAQYLTGLYNNAAISYYKALEINAAIPGLYNNLGIVCMRLKRYPEALAAFSKAIELQGESKEIRNSLGKVFSEMGRGPEAVSQYRRALEIDPDYQDARGNMAIEMIAAGDFQGAEAQLRTVLQRQPGSGIARFHLGRTLHLLGNNEAAAVQLEKAAEFMPDPKEALLLLRTVSGGRKTR